MKDDLWIFPAKELPKTKESKFSPEEIPVRVITKDGREMDAKFVTFDTLGSKSFW